MKTEEMNMKTDYITSDTPLLPHLLYPRFLLGVNVRFTAKELYIIILNMVLNAENIQTDQQGRCYLAFFNKTVAEIIDRTPSTVAQALRELEAVGLVEKKLIALHAPYHIYVKLPVTGSSRLGDPDTPDTANGL